MRELLGNLVLFIADMKAVLRYFQIKYKNFQKILDKN